MQSPPEMRGLLLMICEPSKVPVDEALSNRRHPSGLRSGLQSGEEADQEIMTKINQHVRLPSGSGECHTIGSGALFCIAAIPVHIRCFLPSTTLRGYTPSFTPWPP